MSAPQFPFETEFTLLDVGATGALVRTGGVRPSVVAYHADRGPESAILEWPADAGPGEAFEEARRWLRTVGPVAYAFVGVLRHNADGTVFASAGEKPGDGSLLGLALRAAQGEVRGALYPIKEGPKGRSLGVPTITDSDTTDWCPIGDVWANPFCAGDTVQFRPPERAVDPSSPLWKAMVELTKLRVQTDLYKSQEYMLFLDDLRNGVFTVAGRSPTDPMVVALKPRTTYNPLGYLIVHASKLALAPDDEAHNRPGGSL